MKVLGITGGCGSGKSEIVTMIESKYKTYSISADKIGHEIIKKGTPSYNLIINHFGLEIVSSDGEIDRKKLGDIVFSNKNELLQLNDFTHPYIYSEIKNKIEYFKEQDVYDFIVLEAAIMDDIKLINFVDIMFYIHCNYNERLRRLIQYRNITEIKAKKMIDSQPNDDEYKAIADYIIDNSNSIENSKEQLINIMSIIKEDK